MSHFILKNSILNHITILQKQCIKLIITNSIAAPLLLIISAYACEKVAYLYKFLEIIYSNMLSKNFPIDDLATPIQLFD